MWCSPAPVPWPDRSLPETEKRVTRTTCWSTRWGAGGDVRVKRQVHRSFAPAVLFAQNKNVTLTNTHRTSRRRDRITFRYPKGMARSAVSLVSLLLGERIARVTQLIDDIHYSLIYLDTRSTIWNNSQVYGVPGSFVRSGMSIYFESNLSPSLGTIWILTRRGCKLTRRSPQNFRNCFYVNFEMDDVCYVLEIYRIKFLSTERNSVLKLRANRSGKKYFSHLYNG